MAILHFYTRCQTFCTIGSRSAISILSAMTAIGCYIIVSRIFVIPRTASTAAATAAARTTGANAAGFSAETAAATAAAAG